jgi:dTDP-glucose 4,6-dehydratase
VTKLRIRHLLVAGGAGFLGSAFVRDRLRADQEIEITALDALRRPGARPDLADLADDKRFTLVEGDIRDVALVERLAAGVDAIVSFATEDGADGASLARTDVEGNAVLLEAARKCRHQRFLLASTDEVYGPPRPAPSREEDRLAPRSVTAAARAAAEALAGAYFASHDLPVLITRGVTAYGPRQPAGQPVGRLIAGALSGQSLVIDGDGSATRDYLHVDDQVAAMARVMWKGEPGSVYNIASGAQVSGSQLADLILHLCGKPTSLKHFKKDERVFTLAIDARRMRPLGWEPRMTLNEGLRSTVEWYRANSAWWQRAAAA